MEGANNNSKMINKTHWVFDYIMDQQKDNYKDNNPKTNQNFNKDPMLLDLKQGQIIIQGVKKELLL